MYDDKLQDFSKQINIGPEVSLFTLVTGAKMSSSLDNPFVRFHKSIAEYPEFHDDMDDI
jgi:hypothetical protein